MTSETFYGGTITAGPTGATDSTVIFTISAWGGTYPRESDAARELREWMEECERVAEIEAVTARLRVASVLLPSFRVRPAPPPRVAWPAQVRAFAG